MDSVKTVPGTTAPAGTLQKVLFFLGLLFCCSPYASPPVALALGLALALTLGNPFKKQSGKVSKYLLQFSVVGLGFGMNFAEVLRAGRTGVTFTAFSICGTLFAGWLLGRWLSVNRRIAFLISSGTAICGGSAIAAVGPVIKADENDMSVALGTIFILNAVALFLFPPLGHLFHLSQQQFGLWSAIAIHDTSSVVGAAARYGSEALKIATTVKLTRALWIIPLTLFAAVVFKNKSSKVTIPWFIFCFVLASIVTSLLPSLQALYGGIVHLAKTGLTVTLFLIGAGLSRETLRTVGVRPVVKGVLLWTVVSVVSFIVVAGMRF
jgi:uncharacterized integral membrane protein (TIGR00698 family)